MAWNGMGGTGDGGGGVGGCWPEENGLAWGIVRRTIAGADTGSYRWDPWPGAGSGTLHGQLRMLDSNWKYRQEQG